MSRQTTTSPQPERNTGPGSRPSDRHRKRRSPSCHRLGHDPPTRNLRRHGPGHRGRRTPQNSPRIRPRRQPRPLNPQRADDRQHPRIRGAARDRTESRPATGGHPSSRRTRPLDRRTSPFGYESDGMTGSGKRSRRHPSGIRRCTRRCTPGTDSPRLERSRAMDPTTSPQSRPERQAVAVACLDRTRRLGKPPLRRASRSRTGTRTRPAENREFTPSRGPG